MKWYCIKKYIPNSSVEMLIRAISTGLYERYFIASLELSDNGFNYDNRELLNNWEMANCAHHDINIEQYTVTHFCPLEPVEDV